MVLLIMRIFDMCKDNVRELSINVVLSACDRYLKSAEENDQQYNQEYENVVQNIHTNNPGFFIKIDGYWYSKTQAEHDMKKYIDQLIFAHDPRVDKLRELNSVREPSLHKMIINGLKKLCEVQDSNSNTVIITSDTALILKDFL